MTKAKIYSCARILLAVACASAAVMINFKGSELVIPVLLLISALALIDEVVTRVNVAIHRALKQRGRNCDEAAVR